MGWDHQLVYFWALPAASWAQEKPAHFDSEPTCFFLRGFFKRPRPTGVYSLLVVHDTENTVPWLQRVLGVRLLIVALQPFQNKSKSFVSNRFLNVSIPDSIPSVILSQKFCRKPLGVFSKVIGIPYSNFWYVFIYTFIFFKMMVVSSKRIFSGPALLGSLPFLTAHFQIQQWNVARVSILFGGQICLQSM